MLYRFRSKPFATPGPCLVCGLPAVPLTALRYDSTCGTTTSRAHRECLRLPPDWSTATHRPPGDIEVTAHPVPKKAPANVQDGPKQGSKD